MKKAEVSFKLINWIKKKSIGRVLVTFVIIYIIVNVLFGIGYYVLNQNNMCLSSTDSNSLLNFVDCVYFSFITASTIGYGDINPLTIYGKVLVMFQSIFCAVYIAIMMSIITSKLLWAKEKTITFSQKILYNTKLNAFQVRIINTNSMPIVNPEIRISVTQHGVGDIIAGVLELDNSQARPTYLGRHDFTLTLGRSYSECEIILEELKRAINHEKASHKKDSRFRITITISGSNGVQNIAEIKKYYATDFVKGTGFEAIKYENNDEDELGMVYKKIPSFWKQFEQIKEQEEI